MTKISDLRRLELGVQGENLSRTIEIDCTEWYEEFPDGIVNIILRQPTQSVLYMASTTYTDGILSFSPTSSDTNYAGVGRAEIRLTQGSVVAKSINVPTIINPSINGVDSDLPEAYQTYIDELLEAADTINLGIAEVEGDLATEVTNRQNADATLQSNIEAEATERQNNYYTKTETDNKLDLKANLTESGYSITLAMDGDYKITATLKDRNGNTITTSNAIDLPMESVVVSGRYDSVNKAIVLELENGTDITIPVGDLIGGLVSESTRIAGIDLADDITANELKIALSLGNVDNTSDLDKPVSTATQQALDTKLDKVTATQKVYATDGSGNQTTFDYTAEAVANTIPKRDENGRFKVASPSADNDTANKSYVDGAIDDLKDDLENGDTPVKALTTKQVEALTENSGTIQETPFIFQGTGTDNNTSETPTSPVGKQLEKQGNTVVVNQLVKNGNFVDMSNWGGSAISSVSNNTLHSLANVQYGSFNQASFPMINGHIYLYCISHKGTTGSFSIYFSSGKYFGTFSYVTHNDFTLVSGTFTYDKASGTETLIFQDNRASDWTEQEWQNIYLIDLTQWFGSNDLIPQDLLDNPSHFINYYNGSLAYNTGTLTNCDGEVLETIGFNQFAGNSTDNPQYIGNYYIGTPTYSRESNSNYNCFRIKVIANQSYCISRQVSTLSTMAIFRYVDENYALINGDTTGYSSTQGIKTIPANCKYVEFSIPKTLSQDTICFNLSWDGQRDGEYQPHIKHTYNTGTEALRSAGSVRDVKAPDGTITRNIKDTTFTGQETMDYGQWRDGAITIRVSTSVYKAQLTTNANIVCDKWSDMLCVHVGDYNYYYFLGATSKFNDTASFASYIAGANAFFALSTPTTEQGTPFAENIEIDDYGTMGWKDGNDDYVAVPQGCKIFYPVDYVLLADDLNNYTNGDVTKLALKSEITDTALNARGYYKIEDLSSGITDSAGLTYSVKKAYKIGNLVTLTIKATNNTGSEIAAATALFSLSSNLYSTELLVLVGRAAGNIVGVNISQYGLVSMPTQAIPDGQTFYLSVTYAVS